MTINFRGVLGGIASPAPFYNFAITPTVRTRDAFWVAKQTVTIETPSRLAYKAVHLPKNSGMGVIIAGFAFLLGFSLIWHMWWLAGLGVVGVVVCVILRASNDDTEYTISAEQMEQLDAATKLGRQQA